MFGWLFLIGVVVIIVSMVRDGGKSSSPSQQNQINQQWVDYLAAYYLNTKNKTEKALLLKMLADLEAQGMPRPTMPMGMAAGVVDTEEYEKHLAQNLPAVSDTQPAMVAALETAQPASVQAVPDWNGYPEHSPPAREPVQLDNTTLLLYFGAFLFLASAGLFVALTGAYGPLRVFTVLAVMAALYFGGFWLHDNKPKLQQAGYTFIGMGMMLAPLAGLATYSYVLRSQPHLVWFLTSVLCLMLYGHALSKLKTALMEYIFIGTFLSLFESAVSIVQLPVYYYGWGLATVGLLLQAWAMYRGKAGVFEEPTTTSGSLLITASVFTGIYMAPNYGYVQLGVSLLLAALYYGLQAWKSTAEETARVANAAVAQSALLLSAASFAYAWQHHLPQVGMTLVILGLVQAVVLLVRKNSVFTQVFGNIAIISLVLAVFLAWSEPWQAVIAAAVTVLFSLMVWLRQERADMYAVGMGGLAALPFMVGLHAASVRWHAAQLLWATAAVIALQLVSFFAARRSKYATAEWYANWQGVQLLTMALALFVALFVQSGAVVATGAAVALLSYCLARVAQVKVAWVNASSIFASLPVLFTVSHSAMWCAALVVALGWNLVLVFSDRLELARWLGGAAWLLLPIGLGRSVDSLSTPTWYAVSYLVVMCGFMVARAVAQKRIARLPIALSELETRLHTDSQAYVAGYVLAAVASFGASFQASRVWPAVIGGALIGLVWVIARSIEHQPDIMLFIPLLAQAALWGTYRSGSSVNAYVMGSSALAALGYGANRLQSTGKGLQYLQKLQQSSLYMLYVAPATVFFFGTSWLMPAALAVAGVATLHAVWSHAQDQRELAGGVLLVSLMWVLWYAGVDNTQVYTHLLAALFGLYAYWRFQLGDKETSHSYVVAMLCAATIPLGLQVMSRDKGGLYGWWFLGEQIAIMLLGMSMRDRFVTRWGMYVAVGAVLYQLRALAWLSLTLLALFLIGLAIYRLQKSDNSDKK